MNRRKTKPRHACEMCGEGDFPAKRKFCPACKKVRDTAQRRELAEEHKKAKALRMRQHGPRTCLHCGKTFKSTGPGHRRCEKCDGLDVMRLPANRAGAVICYSTAGYTTRGNIDIY